MRGSTSPWRWLVRALLVGLISASLSTAISLAVYPQTPCPVLLLDNSMTACGLP